MPATKRLSVGTPGPVSSPRPRGPLKLEGNLPYRLSYISFLVGKATSKIHGASGLGTHEWKLLSVLDSYEPISAQQITRLVTFDKATISRGLRQLTKKKLVQRQLCAVDARSVEVRLTPAGRRLHAALAKQTATLQAELLQTVRSNERAALFSALRKIEERLRKI